MKTIRILLLLLATIPLSCSPGQSNVNLALRHKACHSGSADFNFTAQLAFDGIIESSQPAWVEMCGNEGKPLSKLEHDIPLEPRQWTALTVDGPSAELSLRTHGFTEQIDKVSMTFEATLGEAKNENGYKAELQVLDADGEWTALKTFKGKYHGGRLTLFWEGKGELAPEGWRFTLEMPGAETIEWQEWRFYRKGKLLPMLSSEHFSSNWVSPTGGQEWIMVDLGETKRINEVKMHWLNAPAKGVLQASVDSLEWKNLADVSSLAQIACNSVKLNSRARWLRLALDSSFDGKPYILTEMEVFGPVRKEKAARDEKCIMPVPEGRRIDLDNGWELARLAQSGDSSAWIPATVPGTVLASYIDNGIVPDPNYGDNQQYISDSYFLVPFVYRCSFKLPEGYLKKSPDEHLRLNFDGINWKADVRFNGTGIGRIEGAFTDASFDITPLLADENTVEVIVYPPANPGMTKSNTLERCATNGGVLGADNPTFHASVGWDWIPSIRGRNMGIWNDVWMERTGAVRICNPMAVTKLGTRESPSLEPDTTKALITLSAVLVNDSDREQESLWHGSYGELPFSRKVTIPAGASLPVSEQLVLENPSLWWPNGYGEPHLYTVKMRAGDSHELSFQSGVRQIRYSTSGNNLRIWVNGRRFIGRGGNWGFSESNLRYRAGDYETAMRLHRHENFNLVRNWVGMTGDEELYEAADRNGIFIWQDFWLANPSDGPDPEDEDLFMQNAQNMLLRVRKHCCLLLWCGRNEGYPPESLDRELRRLVTVSHPESFYLSSSADDFVSGRGPYNRLHSKEYWRLFDIPWFKDESLKFHSERGMPNFPNYESLIAMMPEAETWPPSRMWGIHDFAMQSAQRGETFIAAVDSAFGPSSDAAIFASRAQWINYEGYRAMFESRSRHRRGLLLWMSHPAWPSMAFCTYDWYLDATASYYACRKACESIHIQWNPDNGQVEVANYCAGDRKGLMVKAELRNFRGEILSTKELLTDSEEDSTVPCFQMDFGTSGQLHFLRLQLFEGDKLLSHNDYFIPERELDLKVLASLPEAGLKCETVFSPESGKAALRLANISDTPALMLHIVARRADGSRILPALWSDNYIHLMPGEERELSCELPKGESEPVIEVNGFNLRTVTNTGRSGKNLF